MQNRQRPSLVWRRLFSVCYVLPFLFFPALAESPSIHDLIVLSEPPVLAQHPYYDLPKAGACFWFGRPYGLPDVADFSLAAGSARGTWNAGASVKGFRLGDVYRRYQANAFGQKSLGARIRIVIRTGFSAELFSGNETIYQPQAGAAMGCHVHSFLRVFAGCHMDSIPRRIEPYGGIIFYPKAKGPVILHLQRAQGLFALSFSQSLPLANRIDAFWGIRNNPVRLDMGLRLGATKWAWLDFLYGTHNRLGGSYQGGLFVHRPD